MKDFPKDLSLLGYDTFFVGEYQSSQRILLHGFIFL
jgi:hypothetical protein